jgi:putative ABC transport system permease protein
VFTGYLISFAGAAYSGISFSTRIDIMLLTVGFSMVIGVAFGIYPAAKASNLKPVDALRIE